MILNIFLPEILIQWSAMNEQLGIAPIPWTLDDIHRVDTLVRERGENLLPRTERGSNTPTWDFYETFIHILEGDAEFDFSDFDEEDLRQIDWQEICSVIQMAKGEEPEEYDASIVGDQERNLGRMKVVRDFLQRRFEKDFGMPDPENLQK